VKLELSTWTSHLNQLIYSYFYFCEKENIKVNIVKNNNIKNNSAILYVSDRSVFFLIIQMI
jgi:hypothetical protein